jgi:uncharacterized membrane protein
MNIPVIVDVAIGLIFIYLILSLLASEILELIATVLQWRAQHLRQSIINLLAGDTITDQNIEAAKRLTKDLYNHPLLNDLNQEARGLFATLFRKITWFFSLFYQWLTGREGAFGNKVTAPSYIPGETFATALIERLGVAKLVEPLIDAKFNRFRRSIVENIGSLIGCSAESLNSQKPEQGLETKLFEAYKALNDNLGEICNQFSKHELSLIAAIDKISLQIDWFINQLKNDDPKKQVLASWKRGLFGKQNELAIVNGSLKPTLEEVADLVNTSSITYQSFKKAFETYREQRNNEVTEELKDFVLVFDSIVRRIMIKGETEVEYPSWDGILTSSEYSMIWATGSNPNKTEIYPFLKPKTSTHSEDKKANSIATSPGSDTATTSPQPKAGSTPSELKIAISLTRVDEEVVGILNKIIKHENIKDYPNAKQNLEAFKQGFNEQPKELLGSKVIPTTREWFLIAFLVLCLVYPLVSVLLFRKFFVTPQGGIVFGLVIVAPIISIIIVRCIKFIIEKLTSKEKPNHINQYASGSLSNTLDNYVGSASKPELQKFKDNFNENFKKLEKLDDKIRIWELKRLGQSFRQYYRALVLNNADFDLPFIPSSVKQSVSSLVRRTKAKIDRAGDEVNQLREEVEIWFDRSMDRSSGVYKRNARGITILIGFLLAAITNSDSIYIVNRLASDQELRQGVVEGAERFITSENQPSPSASPTPLTEEQLRDLRDRSQRVSQLLNEQLALPIGWNPRVLGRQLGCEFPKNAGDKDWQKLFDKCINLPSNKTIEDDFDNIYNQVVDTKKFAGEGIYKEAQRQYEEVREKMNKPKDYFLPTAVLAMMLTSGKWYLGLLFLIGWFVTAIAISMGATFWFELLGKLVNVRNTGNRPPSSANQTSVNSEKTSE